MAGYNPPPNAAQDITKSTIPILFAIALGGLGFTIGTSFNSSVKDIQNLQASVLALGNDLRNIQVSLAAQNQVYLTGKDLQIFCLSLIATNKGLKCSTTQ